MVGQRNFSVNARTSERTVEANMFPWKKITIIVIHEIS